MEYKINGFRIRIKKYFGGWYRASTNHNATAEIIDQMLDYKPTEDEAKSDFVRLSNSNSELSDFIIEA